MKKSKQNMKVAAVGLAMGIAETIPGVSGGTIAFICRIYEELLDTIKSITPETLKLLLQGKFKSFFLAINGVFLLNLILGMGIGVIVGVLLISYLLENHPLPLWSFFFGLVLSSAIYLTQDVQWNVKRILFLCVGILASFLITLIAPTNGSDNLILVMLSGIIAISALMLPGLSGSFILLLLGMYSTVIGSVKNLISSPNIGQDLYILIVFGVGCLIGLFSFSRVLSYTLKKYFDSTMALMIGVLIGSLNKLWPWRIPDQVMNKSSEEIMSWSSDLKIDSENIKIITESTLLPNNYAAYHPPQLLLCILSALLASSIIFMISRNKSA